MKNCKTVKGLVNTIKKGEVALLKVWDIMDGIGAEGKGAYLNLGEGKFAGVGEENWLLIREWIVDQNGIWCSEDKKYSRFYQDQKYTCAYCGKEITTNELQRYPSEDARAKECYCSDCFMRNSVEM